MAVEQSRRDFIGMAFGGVAAVGGVIALGAMKKTWDPLPSVLAGGFTEIELSAIKAGEPETFTWRGKPIFVLKKTAAMENSTRDLVVGTDRFTVAIGLCTHLGCIPAWKKDTWKCACHGGEFNASAKQTFGPPPRPLDLPPFSVKGTSITLGEEGPEYQAIAATLKKA